MSHKSLNLVLFKLPNRLCSSSGQIHRGKCWDTNQSPLLPSSILWPIFRGRGKCFSIYHTATFLPILTSVQHSCYLWETLTLALYILNESKSNQSLFSKQWWHLRSHIVQYYWYALIIFPFTFLLVSLWCLQPWALAQSAWCVYTHILRKVRLSKSSLILFKSLPFLQIFSSEFGCIFQLRI